MTREELYAAPDEPFQHKLMSPMARALFGLGMAHVQSVASTVADHRGTPEAIAEARKRLREAQERANLIVLYGACPVCSTPFTSDVAVCAVCPPRVGSEGPTREGSAAWAAREACFAEGDE
jgi:hypothetical protein